MRESLFEALIGFVVVAVAAIFLFFSLQQRSDGAGGDSYTLTAKFGRADGIAPGTDVRIAGVKVGTVSAISLDPIKLKADVKISLKNGIKVPDDSTAQIQTDSLLGGSYIYVLAGGSEENLPTDGKGKFEYTRDSIDIFGQLVAAFGNSGGSEGDQGGGSKTDGGSSP